MLECVRVDKEDEMTCLIKGCNFVLKNIPHEAFVYAKHADSEFRFHTTRPDIFPYLLVNIGSGVSIVKVIYNESFCLWFRGPPRLESHTFMIDRTNSPVLRLPSSREQGNIGVTCMCMYESDKGQKLNCMSLCLFLTG